MKLNHLFYTIRTESIPKKCVLKEVAGKMEKFTTFIWWVGSWCSSNVWLIQLIFMCVSSLLSFLLVLFSSRGFSFIYTAECVCVVVLASAEKSNCMNHIWPAENKNNMNRMSKGYWNIHTWCTKISEFWNPLETFVCQFSHPL